MIVTFDKDILNAAVTPAMSAVSTKNTHPAIDGIRITASEDGTCVLNSFDLEKGIQYTIRASVEEAGSYIINGQKLMQIIRSMPDQVRIAVDEKTQAKITSGRSEFTLNAMHGEDFPNTPELEGDWGFTMPQCELRDAISRVLYAVAVNEPRPMLNGVFFRIEDNKITLAATDSFRLAVCEKEMDLHTHAVGESRYPSMIVPGKAVVELLKMLHDDAQPVRILATKKHVIFEMGALVFFSRLIDAEYVEYEKFIPKNPTVSVILPCAALRESLERAALVTEDKALGQAKSYVKFSFEDQILQVSAISVSGTVLDEIPVEKSGPDLKIGFNCRNVLDALRACDAEYIHLSLVGQLVSMVITYAEDRYTEEEKKDISRRREELGLTGESFLHLLVPLHMKE